MDWNGCTTVPLYASDGLVRRAKSLQQQTEDVGHSRQACAYQFSIDPNA